jgi:hypothetical protein
MARLICLLFLLPLSAWAEIGSIIAGALTSWGASSLVANSILPATIFGASTVAIGFAVGSAVYGQAKAKRQMNKAAAAARDQYNASLQDRTQTILSANPPARVIYGTSTVAGSPVAIFTSGDKDQYKHVVIEWAHHECEAIDDIYIAGESIGTLDGSGFATEGKYFKTTSTPTSVSITTDGSGMFDTGVADAIFVSATTSGGGESPDINHGGSITSGVYTGPANTWMYLSYTRGLDRSLIRVQHHLGSTSQAADAYLMSVSGGKWTASHQGKERCYSVFTFDLNESEFQSGFPNATAKIRGKKVYDPRTLTTYWTPNAALCIADYIASPLGKNSNYANIIESDLIAAANVCDEDVTPSGGTTYNRYEINGSFTVDDDPLESMAQAMAGVVSCPNGWSIMAGAYSAPVLTLNDSDVLGDIEVINGVSRADLFNSVTGQYYPLDNPHVQADFAPYSNSTYIAADGEELQTTINYQFTNNPAAVEQLNRIAVEDHRQALTLKFPTGLKAWELKVGQRVTVNNTLFAFSSKVFRVMEWSLGVQTPVQLTLKEDAVGIWDLADDAVYDQAPNNSQSDPWVIGAVNLGTPESGTSHLKKMGDGTIASRIYLPYAGSEDVNVVNGGRLEIEINRPTVSSVWNAVPSAAGDSTFAYIDNVVDGAVYNIRARWANALTYGDWAYKAHQVVGQTQAPEPFDFFVVLVQPDGTRQFNFGYTTTAKPTDWLGAEIRSLPGTHASPDWDAMTLLNDTQTYYTASPVESNQLLSGDYTFACKSRDRTGNLSSYKIHSITLPRRRLGDTAAEFVDTFDGAKTDCSLIDGMLEANGMVTWAAAGTWDSAGDWNETPATPIVYTGLVKDIGAVISGFLDVEILADGSMTQEVRYSSTSDDPVVDPGEWSSWVSADTQITGRWLQYRVTVAANGSFPVPVIRSLTYRVTSPTISNYLNDEDISTYTGSYRIATGDVRIPLPQTYTTILRISAVIQDATAGQWTWQVVDKVLTYGPRVQFKLDGTLTDPDLVDFFVEGF